MPYPVADNTPSLSGSYIPNLFAGKMLVAFYAMTCLALIANTDYEGEIKKAGDKVTVRLLPDIDVHNYVKGAGLTRQTLNPATVDLLIDHGKYWSIRDFDIDRVQSDLEYAGQVATHAAETLKIQVELDVFGNVYADSHAANKGDAAGKITGAYNLGKANTPLEVGTTNAIQVLFDMASVLREQNVPGEGRWAVLPDWFINRLLNSDLTASYFSGDQSNKALRAGEVGTIAGFRIFNSNNLSISDEGATNAMFGHRSGLTFASQLVKNRTMQDPDDFAELLEGLHVYGFEGIKPEALGHLYITPAEEAA